MKTFFLSSAFLALLLSLQISHAEQFYKWTDDKGVVHYSQQPPHGTKSEPVKTHNTQSSDAKQQSVTTETESEGTEQEQKQASVEKIKKDPALCQQAKDDAQMLRQKPIVRRNNKVMTIDEKNAALEELNEIMKINC